MLSVSYSGAPPSYVFVNRVYRRNLRPVVVAFSALSAIYTLAWTVVSFKELTLDNDDHFPKLAPFAIVQGVLFLVACLIEVFGVASAAMQRLVFVRLYAFLSGFSALLVIGVGLMRSIIHFTFKDDLLTECTTAVRGGDVGAVCTNFPDTLWLLIDCHQVFGLWGSYPTDIPSDVDATSYCQNQWSHDSWVEIITTIIEIVLGLLFTWIAFAYYRQLLDPASPANSSRAPSNQARMDDYPSHYNPPYGSATDIPYDSPYANAYAPPAGPPPSDGKPPSYAYAGGDFTSYGEDKDDKKDDPFSDFDGPSVPRPLHFAEERDVTSRAWPEDDSSRH
ncbi:hypothetical protein BV22DRAFT_318303 [Leucogyrophana mollusca]|uniref:Uncharacterized protein n=1 Tax=Leucogyrophana mollusca TaxID=85980 RepID=A0ACB8BPV9_9AGAM|nr:hypothetical protein BV22DRAFT_318303 [Leucogyrophana mollusca]